MGVLGQEPGHEITATRGNHTVVFTLRVLCDLLFKPQFFEQKVAKSVKRIQRGHIRFTASCRSTRY